MKKRCFALLLALSLLLTGCSPLFDLYSAARGEYTRPDYSDGAISYREFQRPYQPRVKYTAEPDIEYVRPDVDSLCSTLKSIGASATGGKAAAADIINQFDAAYDDYVLFNTMGELAYLRYTRDLSDSYYEAEYTWCTDQTTRVEKAMEDCYTTMAKSSLRSALEEQYFGEDFFASYDSDGVYSDARTVALLQQESELQAQYVALQNDPSIKSPFLRQVIDDVRDEVKKMTKLVSDLLVVARSDNKALKLKPQKFNLSALIEQTARLMQPLADQKKIDLQAEHLPKVEIQADEQKIRQLVLILVDNAVKYTPDGGKVSVRYESTEKGKVRFAVSDTGIGIAKEDQAKVFDRFYRVDKARSREMGGNGLGLAIAQEIVHLHKGRIWIQSELGKGTTFFVELRQKFK